VIYLNWPAEMLPFHPHLRLWSGPFPWDFPY
jgi:hypothetical protein